MTDRLAGVAVRAIVVEQLNRDQWHSVPKGREVPRDSMEGRAGGVLYFCAALRDAPETSLFTGLPVLVQPLRRRERVLLPPEMIERERMSADLLRSLRPPRSLAYVMDDRPDGSPQGGRAA